MLREKTSASTLKPAHIKLQEQPPRCELGCAACFTRTHLERSVRRLPAATRPKNTHRWLPSFSLIVTLLPQLTLRLTVC